MKIALAQLNYHIGDFASNTARIIEKIELAKTRQADLIVFAELSVCGYPPRDFLEFNDFINCCQESIGKIARHCIGIAAIVGSPSVNHAPKGKPLFNSAYFLADGEIKSIVNKTLLPNYDVFDEYRYFEPNRVPYSVIAYKGWRLAVTICEDLWNITDDPLYVRNPMDEYTVLNPDLIINIAASPFHYNQHEIRREILSQNAVNYGLPLVYVNQVGGQTELIFDGESMVIDSTGIVVTALKDFEEDFLIQKIEKTAEVIRQQNIASTTQTLQLTNLPTYNLTNSFSVPRIHDALILGIKDYFGKMGFQRAIIGLSGGIDSAVTLVLATLALGNENVRAVLLPSQFSSDHSIVDALELTANLNIQNDIIPIEGAFDAIAQTLSSQFKGLPFNLAEENIQARLRAVILMAMSNKFGYILLNTSNKSEAAVGYGTLYGDMCGGLSVLGDVYKTQVYQLAQYINQKNTVIPQNSITKPPSAELRPNQKDSDSLPDYDLLDKILYLYIEHRYGPSELISEGFDEATVSRVLKLVNASEYKRYQTPPILRVSPKAFGQGRRMPIVGKYLS
ncbi:MAG: NAD+ synthase [Bacteroidetes bacterium]|nr:NAD+ synthase [Bacteroidota bacterium]